jgi:NAD(P)-dependent dehydrogenase (short-subunit alcohol dehydrogenase family)
VSAERRVVVVTGMGGMGASIAQRVGPGSTLVLADVDPELLDREASILAATGYDVERHVVDVARKESVDALATAAAALGPVSAVVHTAGVSPVQAPVDAVLSVDLVGTALMLDAFGAVVAAGGAGVFIASMAGSMMTLDPDFEARLATTPTEHLLELAELAPDVLSDPGAAYAIAKRGNQVRVRAASLAWGRRGARVNSISPGVISTPMGASELDGPSGAGMRSMIAGSGTGRIGTPEDITAAVDFLIGPHAGFITGTDLLVDGGVVAMVRTPRS